MSLSAEYMLKQGKLQMGIDSNLTVKSVVETGLDTNIQLQFCAEANQPKNTYRFGYGLMIG
jgi:hypothetical protein